MRGSNTQTQQLELNLYSILVIEIFRERHQNAVLTTFTPISYYSNVNLPFTQ